MDDACRPDVALGALAQELGHHPGIAHGAERVGRAIGHEVGAPSLPTQTLFDGAQAGVAVRIPRNRVHHRAEQAAEQDVAGRLVAGLRVSHAAMHDTEMAFEAEPRRGRRHLAGDVGLHHTAADDQIGARRLRRREIVFELAQLAAAEAEPGAVVALDPQARAAEPGRKPPHRLERGG